MPDWYLPDDAEPTVATRDEMATAAQIGLFIWWLHGEPPVMVTVEMGNLLEAALTPLVEGLLGRAVVGRIDLHDDGWSMDVEVERQRGLSDEQVDRIVAAMRERRGGGEPA